MFSSKHDQVQTPGERKKTQPVLVSVRIFHDVEEAGKSDKIADTLDYRKIHKIIRSLDYSEDKNKDAYDTIEEFSRDVHDKIQSLNPQAAFLLDLHFPKAMLHSEGIVVRFGWAGNYTGPPSDTVPWRGMAVAVKAMTIPCIIGIGDHERIQKQPVIVDFAVDGSDLSDDSEIEVPSSLSSVFEAFEKSTFLTLEAFDTAVAKHLIVDLGFTEASVGARKPSVFSMADGPGVQIYRNVESFDEDE